MSDSRCQYLIALDQCGLELQGPNMRTPAKRLVPAREIDPTALGRDTLRYHAWDPEAVRARYEGLDPATTYEIEATFACERSQRRTMVLTAGGAELAVVDLAPGGATAVRLAVPKSAVQSGALDIGIVRRAGPDAMVSELRLYASAPVPPILTVVGDSRGGLIGTVSDAAYNGIPEVTVDVAWDGGRLSGSTDAHGVFRMALGNGVPQGQARELTVTAAVDGATATRRIDTRALARGLRELPPPSERIDLAGEWRFAPGRHVDPAEAGWAKARPTRVPGHVAFDGLIPDAGVGTLRRTVSIPADWAGDALFLRFDGAYGRAEVFVNGTYAATHSAGATSFDVDITAQARPGDNALTIVLTEATPHAVLDYMSWYAHTSLLGLWREVRLFHVPKLHIGGLDLCADWNPADGAGTLTIGADVINLDAKDESYRLELSVRDGERLLHRTTLKGDAPAAGSIRRIAALAVPDVAPWSAEMPRLYDLEMVLQVGDGRPARYRRRIGFRRVAVVGNQLLVNGAPIRLIGVNRHDARMRTGRAMRTEDLRHDVLALRQANVNVIRTAHYPADPRLLDLCDELGMYVQDQMPICFAAGFDDHHWTRTNDAAPLVPNLLEVTAETVGRDQGHASVIIWDLANETQWAWGFDVQLAMVRRMDPSRPTIFTFDLNQLGDTNPLPQLPKEWRPDLRTYHYPGWDRSWQEDIDWLRSYDQPAVLSECNPPFQDNARAPLHAELMRIDPGLRDFWVTGARPFMARAMRDRGCIGGMIWSAVDDQWVLPLDESIGAGHWAHLHRLDYYRVRDVHPPQDGLVFRGEGEWGLLDGWGRVRPELWHVQKMYSPIEIVSAEFDAGGHHLELALRNRHAHRALETLELRLTGATAGSCQHVAAAPGATASVRIAVDPAARAVSLGFWHPEGWLVDAFSWDVPGRAQDTRAAIRAAAESASISLKGGEAQAGGKAPWLAAWPRLHIQDVNNASAPSPVAVDRARATAAPDGSISAPLSGAGWEGTMTVRADGPETIVHYSCTYSGDGVLDAHEIGLAFDLPAALPDLWWHRVGDWSVYPEGHIGRPCGYAPSAPAPADPLRPAAHWEQDTTPAGSNDYRSTKRAILAAGVTDGKRSVAVLSDGTQHIRATLVNGAPVLHVLDWYGGVPFRLDTDHIWTATFGTGKRIARGTTLQGTITLAEGRLPAEARSNDYGLMEELSA